MDNATELLIAKIADDTGDNFHTEAAIKVARLAGHTEAVAALEKIRATQERVGHMPHELCARRRFYRSAALATITDPDVAEAVRRAL